MNIKSVKVIWSNPINVEGVHREVDEIFPEDIDLREVKNLIQQTYLELIELEKTKEEDKSGTE